MNVKRKPASGAGKVIVDLDEESYAKLKQVSAAYDRTIRNQARYIIKRYLGVLSPPASAEAMALIEELQVKNERLRKAFDAVGKALGAQDDEIRASFAKAASIIGGSSDDPPPSGPPSIDKRGVSCLKR